MYLAEQVLVPGWTIPGEVTFSTYPYAFTATGDLQNTLNWEASGHDSRRWQNFFYITVAAGSLSASQLNSDVMADLYDRVYHSWRSLTRPTFLAGTQVVLFTPLLSWDTTILIRPTRM
jgi:hypothetical protein